MTRGRRLAVVLMNLGGPDKPDAIRPFLFNLFNDPAILEVPGPLRLFLAWLLSRRRAPIARATYAKIGGGSPLLANTQAQARALEAELADLGEVKVFVAMRYWHPMTEATAREVSAWRPSEILLLPLYPQFSGTTSGSSLKRWSEAARACGIAAPARAVCCYPEQPGFVAAAAELIQQALIEASKRGKPRLLLSAHGLPRKTVARGDPYQTQVERSAAAIIKAIARRDPSWNNVDHVVCYQSRVGPLEWLGPYTDEEIRRAGHEGRPVVLFPIAFVSEHSETLVELDIDYRHIAEAEGAPAYIRVPTVGTGAMFIRGLATVARDALARPVMTGSSTGQRLCPAGFGRCAMRGSAR
jgi:ferrochelatase